MSETELAKVLEGYYAWNDYVCGEKMVDHGAALKPNSLNEDPRKQTQITKDVSRGRNSGDMMRHKDDQFISVRDHLTQDTPILPLCMCIYALIGAANQRVLGSHSVLLGCLFSFVK